MQKRSVTCCQVLANRHGLITGATGTGKTVTLQTLAENFSRIGVPVFMADVKGDLTGVSQAGKIGEKLAAILKDRGLALPEPLACPTTVWDVFGEQGHPVRATISDMGPLLLTRMLGLNETQAGVLNLVFKIADDNGLLLLDMKDLRAMLQYVGTTPNSSPPSTATSAPPASAPSSAAWCKSRPRAVTSSLASPCSTSKTSCKPTRKARGW
jgi:DNA helicase HerA-like ATPase